MNAIAFDNSYARLPDRFFAHRPPAPVSAPRLIRFNLPLAAELGLDPAAPWGDIVAGNFIPPGAAPIAMAYAGHQFGHFSPQLGDGRAVLLGEILAPDGRRRDLQLKGSGRTEFSRGGDGRAALGPVLREYIVAEAMHALGIPTTRALAAVSTGDIVYRETEQPGAVLARVAASHIRVGTFQYFAARRDAEGLRLLADHAIARHYPDAAGAANPYRAFFQSVLARQARLVAQWMNVGFIHGVMNTDNTAISGETIDYGPCAFLDEYEPMKVFSSIDHGGRYAYANQPRIIQWNLARLAECLLLLIDENVDIAIEQVKEDLRTFAARFETAYTEGLRHKLGLTAAEGGDLDLAENLLERMAENAADFTRTFRALCAAAEGNDEPARACFSDPAAFDDWATAWRARLARENLAPAHRAARMRTANPAIIPRNHRIEAAIEAAVTGNDFTPFHALVDALAHPWADRPDGLDTLPPGDNERVTRTFCGT